MNSFNFQIVTVANLAAITTPFPDHICYFTEDTENYYIWENDALKEIFVDASSITWNNITNKPTTITGFGITDAVKVSNGTLNYLAKFTPNGTTIGNSIIQDDDIRVGINATPSSDAMLAVSANSSFGNSEDFAIKASNIPFGGSMGGANGIGVTVSNSLGSATGISVSSSGSFNNTATGIHVIASDATNKYALQLQDGTEVLAGRYLRNMTTDGKANWAKINITEVTNGLSSTLLGAPNGIATLDSNSKLVMSQMPISVMDYKGTYDIITNTPNLQDGVGNQGDVYVATTAGTRTFGVGNTLTVSVGDWLIYNGTKWEKTLGNNVGSGTVTSVGLSLGTTGTDVNISNSPITSSGNINLNIPTASATARGLLSSSNWTDFNNKIGGSGQAQYIPVFTSDNTVSISPIQTFGQRVGIGVNANSKFAVDSDEEGSGVGSAILGMYSSSLGGTGVIGTSSAIATSSNCGVSGTASGSTSLNTGVSGYSSSSGPSNKNIGVSGVAQGNGINIGISATASASSVARYGMQIKDGTEGSGKFLKCVNGTEGYANWSYLPDSAQIMCSDMVSAITADTSNPKAIWVAPCDGQLTDAFASLRIPQAGGTAFTVLVKTSLVTIATLTFSNGNLQFTSTNPAVTQAFTKGTLFEIFVTQVGDGTAKGLLTTINYERT